MFFISTGFVTATLLAGGSDSAVDLSAFPQGFRLRTTRASSFSGRLSATTTSAASARRKRLVTAAQELLGALGALEDGQVALHLLR